ncbi:MAG TPA: flagellar biosynthetic protein FliR [Anaerolineae bacterium]|nr:flagellar biosynthetic protein FliR [Anaerolineae bacterium]HMR63535.1 flagellar biosynthetic protein FliR [Anaerolineae bacterium]
MALSTQELLNFFLIFTRVLAVLMTAPIFSNRTMPTIAKIGFAGLLALLMLPISATADPLPLPTELFPFLLVTAQEVLVGVVIGFASNLVFQAVAIGAGMMSLQSGFQAARLFDPFTNASSTALEQFYSLLVIALFLSINGHHLLLQALTQTFKLVPLGTFALTEATIGQLVHLTGTIFVNAIRIALPVIGTLLLTDFSLGLIARAVPQVQVFFLGLPLKLGLSLMTLALTLSITLPVVRDLLANIPVDLLSLVK